MRSTMSKITKRFFKVIWFSKLSFIGKFQKQYSSFENSVGTVIYHIHKSLGPFTKIARPDRTECLKLGNDFPVNFCPSISQPMRSLLPLKKRCQGIGNKSAAANHRLFYFQRLKLRSINHSSNGAIYGGFLGMWFFSVLILRRIPQLLR